MVVGNLMYAGGSFAADFNETHVKNPRWPPHAKVDYTLCSDMTETKLMS